MQKHLWEIAKLIRSKNAGPFLLTFDIMFDEEAHYDAVRKSGVISKERISQAFGVPETDVQIFQYDPALAFKITIPRPKHSGDLRDGDVFGGQQYAPLVNLEIVLP